MQKTTSTSRFILKSKKLFDNSPVIVVLGIIVFVISSITTIINDGTDLMYKARSGIGWRGFEEKIINSLNASIRIEKFRETLGEPLFYREGKNGYGEHVFRRRDGSYWIQAITDKQGTVVVYSVTSCDSSFKPLINYSPKGRLIRLGKTTFKEAASGDRVGYNYFISLATENSSLIEAYPGGNHTNYQSEYWGINDACDRVSFDNLYPRNLPEKLVMDKQLDENDPILQQFRGKFPINTYAVTTPFEGGIAEDFQIGVDRLQIRVVYP